MKTIDTLQEALGFLPNYNYSTMRAGGLDQRTQYNGETIIWGLREKGYAPSLIHPRPKISLLNEEGVEVANEQNDYAMHRCIEQYNSKEIIKAMFDKSIVLIVK